MPAAQLSRRGGRVEDEGRIIGQVQGHVARCGGDGPVCRRTAVERDVAAPGVDVHRSVEGARLHVAAARSRRHIPSGAEHLDVTRPGRERHRRTDRTDAKVAGAGGGVDRTQHLANLLIARSGAGANLRPGRDGDVVVDSDVAAQRLGLDLANLHAVSTLGIGGFASTPFTRSMASSSANGELCARMWPTIRTVSSGPVTTWIRPDPAGDAQVDRTVDLKRPLKCPGRGDDLGVDAAAQHGALPPRPAGYGHQLRSHDRHLRDWTSCSCTGVQADVTALSAVGHASDRTRARPPRGSRARLGGPPRCRVAPSGRGGSTTRAADRPLGPVDGGVTRWPPRPPSSP